VDVAALIVTRSGGTKMRPLIACILIGLGATSAQAQGSACTYDSCALRVRTRLFSGVSIVQGHEARRVAKVGMFAPRVDVLAGGSDSVRNHYQAFRSHQNTGGVLTLVGVVAAGVAGGLAGRDYEANKTAVWSLLGVSLVFSLWGGAHVAAGNDQLQQSIWFYNRDLPR
jgi:hypothetical protein